MIVAEEIYLTPGEVARRLRVEPETVMQWLRQRKLGGYKAGRLWRISETDYQKFLRENYNEPQEEK